MHDPLSIVARDLAALSRSDRRAILRALEPADRDRMHLAMRGRTPASDIAADHATSHSPWVEQLVADAAADRGPMTPAARAALLDAIGDARAGTPRAPTRSLLQAAGSLLGQAIVP